MVFYDENKVCQPLFDRHSIPSLALNPLTMQPDRSRQQDRDEREEDQHQKDRPSGRRKNLKKLRMLPEDIQQFKNMIEQQIIRDQKNLNLKRETIIDIVQANTFTQFILRSSECYDEKEKAQYAFAVVLEKRGEHKSFPAVKVKYPSKIHTKEILVKDIDAFFKKEGKKMLKTLIIYTYNSPCLKRGKHAECCMFLLLDKAYQWYCEYGIETEVVFTVPWGLGGPKYYKALLSSDITQDYDPYIERCKNIPFKVEMNTFRTINKSSGIRDILNDPNYIKEKKSLLLETIKSAESALVTLAETSGLKEEHLDRGKKLITSFTFPLKSQIYEILTKNWNEMVNNSSMQLIRDKICADSQTAAVNCFVRGFKSRFWNSDFLKFSHMPPPKD
ncbi:uncharacterized protein LOC115015078 [Cottoperca gobio]|uniref:Uncharacterized protein LOC115015078 n=1 Tax=Cottoperca gobio TaxID=56716 RepID=A0A6J2QL10_COTGO|nr:uncharacterized protein LOC115015078 [Cottoperca gobio]